jgi:hypothetical protein
MLHDRITKKKDEMNSLVVQEKIQVGDTITSFCASVLAGEYLHKRGVRLREWDWRAFVHGAGTWAEWTEQWKASLQQEGIEKQCSSCFKWKRTREFDVDRAKKTGRMSQCKVCVNRRRGCGKRKRQTRCRECGDELAAQSRSALCPTHKKADEKQRRRSTPWHIVGELVTNMRHRKGSDLTVPDVVYMLLSQGGECALADGHALGRNLDNPFTQMSPDRIDFTVKRYTKDNVRWVMRGFQSCPRKGESLDDSVQWSREKIRACRRNHYTRPWNFVRLPTSKHGQAKRLLRGCKGSAKTRAAVDKENGVTDSRRGECTIDMEWFEARWAAQWGRCAYSRMPMRCQAKVGWKCSVERLDNDLGYTPSNCVLVCNEFNTPAQWSREKFVRYVI